MCDSVDLVKSVGTGEEVVNAYDAKAGKHEEHPEDYTISAAQDKGAPQTIPTPFTLGSK